MLFLLTYLLRKCCIDINIDYVVLKSKSDIETSVAHCNPRVMDRHSGRNRTE